jgi:DNA damage-inducible protein 1
MRVLINLENTDDIREVYIELEENLQFLKYLIEAEFNIPTIQQILVFDNKILENDNLPIRNYNIKEDEIIVVRKGMNTQTKINTNSNSNLSQIFDNTMKMIKQNPSGIQSNPLSIENRVKLECQKLKNFYMNNPEELNILFNTNPVLAEVLVSMDDKRLEDIVRANITKYEDKKKEEQELYNNLMRNPNDAETQKKIEEIIRLKNIDENLKMAEEYLPETFLPVHMLFINLEINKYKVVALVDTGAQTTIISEDLAKKFEIFNLCDTRYSGIAKGVGTSKIIGVIHAAQMKIGDI